jgi:hypothetical protein
VKKPLFLASLLVVCSFLATQTAEATRGCCSWHSGVSYCDSSAGRYVCNDGTYSPTCGCAYSPQVYTPPVYIPPTATPTPIPLRVNATYELSPTTCTYTVIAAWEKPSFYDQYSVSAVQTPSRQCQDPGPVPDTSETKYFFPDLHSGSYLINVRPKNVLGWNYYTYCTAVQLPPVRPTLTVEATKEGGQQYISYSATCATSVNVNNGIGFVPAKQGKFKVYPKGAVIYTLTARSEDGKVEEKPLILTDATPTPTIIPSPVISLTQQPETQTGGMWTAIMHFFSRLLL